MKLTKAVFVYSFNTYALKDRDVKYLIGKEMISPS